MNTKLKTRSRVAQVTLVAGALALAGGQLVAPDALHAQATPLAASPGGETSARATLVDQTGAEVGTATFTETPNEGVLIHVRLTAAPTGEHALHVHEAGRCEPFSAAGDHYAPEDDAHGILHEEGSHAGDLPNLLVPEDGRLEVDLVARDLTLLPNESNTIFDGDGSALIMHQGADDYSSQPSGDAGPEIACGVILR